MLDEGREFITLNTYVSGSDKSEADSNLTLRAAEITGQDKFKVESANILVGIVVGQSLSGERCGEDRRLRFRLQRMTCGEVTLFDWWTNLRLTAL